MSSEHPTPYNGTVAAEYNNDINTPLTEFYRLPLKTCNEITISVKASNDASILLYDGSKSSDASDIKVEIVLGGDKNSTVSVGLSKDDGTGKYAKQLVQKDSALSATHFKVFLIRWYKGRVTIYNHGFKSPFVTWDGPPESQFSSIGVRTVGAAGEWIVQGAPSFKTADSAEYKEIVINTGRLDFEVTSVRDTYVAFTPEPKWSKNPIVHLVLGGWGTAKRSAFWWNFGEVTAVEEPEWPVVQNEYRRFWVKWDAYNLIAGHGDKQYPFLAYNSGATPLPQLNYFALQARQAAPSSLYAHYHILDQVRDADTGAAGQTTQTAQPATVTGGQGDGAQAGYVIFNYQYQQ